MATKNVVILPCFSIFVKSEGKGVMTRIYKTALKNRPEI